MTSRRKGSKAKASVSAAEVGGGEVLEEGRGEVLEVAEGGHRKSLEVGLAGRGRLDLEVQEVSVKTSSLVPRRWRR